MYRFFIYLFCRHSILFVVEFADCETQNDVSTCLVKYSDTYKMYNKINVY